VFAVPKSIAISRPINVDLALIYFPSKKIAISRAADSGESEP
jgi:hypothetical protein